LPQVKVTHIATSDMAIRYLLLDQLLYLKGAGHDVSAICSDGPWVDAVRAAGIVVHTVPFTRRISPLRDIRAAGILIWQLLRHRPDLVHTHTPKASLIGQWVALLMRIRFRVHTIHGLYFPAGTRPGRRGLYAWLERLQMAPAQLVLSQNPEDLETCRRERLCAPAKMRLLGNGIDVARFDPRNADPSRTAGLRTQLGIPADHQVVGTVARLVKEKGYLELFAAIPSVLERHPNTTFMVIGGIEPEKADRIDPADPSIARLGDHLRLLGHRDNVRELYGLMDILVLPSHREGFPRAPMEASATGVPVVVTDIRGCRETVVHGETGLLVPLGDVGALAEAIGTLLGDEELRRRMGRAARRLAEARFDQRLVFERVAAAYGELARSDRPGRNAGNARAGG
jgi:glycosyltransferase involved in cell wall biosynthesis